MVSPKSVSMDMDISSQMLFFLQMDTSHCLDLGTKPFVCGICQQATQLDDL